MFSAIQFPGFSVKECTVQYMEKAGTEEVGEGGGKKVDKMISYTTHVGQD